MGSGSFGGAVGDLSDFGCVMAAVYRGRPEGSIGPFIWRM